MQLNMTKGKPLPVILMFTVPLIIGNVFQQLYNMVDTIIVGRYVGADALAAVGSTGTIMFLITGFSQGITSGFSVRVSQKYGAMDKVAVKRKCRKRNFTVCYFYYDYDRIYLFGDASASSPYEYSGQYL